MTEEHIFPCCSKTVNNFFL